MKKIGFIGTGNMGGAIAQAVSRSTPSGELLLADFSAQKAQQLAGQLGAQATNNRTIAETCDVIFLGVKPQMMEAMLGELAPVLQARQDRFILVTMAAALTCQRIRDMAKGDYPVIRMMPNIPATIGQGVILYCTLGATDEELAAFQALLTPAGLVDPIDEHLIDAATGISGCGPAFAFMFIEALADGGVACGVPRDKALRYAAKMLEGSAAMVLASGQHPGALKDLVCSPGGTTIQGVRALEQGGLRGAAFEAVVATYEKTQALK